MEKIPTANQKRANKLPKLKPKKTKQPLKVVYITNPMKFNASASEFRALVQELTGQDAEIPDSSRFAAAADVGVGKEEGNVRAVEAAAAKVGHGTGDGEVGQKGSDPSPFCSHDDEDNALYNPQMIENWQGFEASVMWLEDAANLE